MTRGPVSRKFRKVYRPEEQFVKLRLGYAENLLSDLACFQDKEEKTNCKVSWQKTSCVSRYGGDYGTRNMPEKFPGFREMGHGSNQGSLSRRQGRKKRESLGWKM